MTSILILNTTAVSPDEVADEIGGWTWCIRSADVKNVLLASLFLAILGLGVVLNVTLLVAILKEKLYHSANNLYILNLAVSDLVLTAGIVFFPFVKFALTSWPFGYLECRLMEMIRDVATTAALLTLTAMSCDRFRAINAKTAAPNTDRQTGSFSCFACVKSRAGLVITATWAVALLCAAPQLDAGKLKIRPDLQASEEVVCMMDEYDYVNPLSMTLVLCTTTFILPLSIIGFNYIAIAIKLFNMSRSLKKHQANTALDRSRKKALNRAKVIVLLVLIFVFCSFPCHFFIWVFYFFKDDVRSGATFWESWRTFGFYLYYLYPILNPVFLYLTSDQYKDLFQKYLACCVRRSVSKDVDRNTSTGPFATTSHTSGTSGTANISKLSSQKEYRV